VLGPNLRVNRRGKKKRKTKKGRGGCVGGKTYGKACLKGGELFEEGASNCLTRNLWPENGGRYSTTRRKKTFYSRDPQRTLNISTIHWSREKKQTEEDKI